MTSIAPPHCCFENKAAQIYQHPLGFLQHVWLPGSQESAALRVAFEALLQHLQGDRVLVDQRYMAPVSPEDSAWYLLDWMPRAVQKGYRYGAVLSPTSLLGRVTTYATGQQAVQNFLVVYQYFKQEPEAVAWLVAQGRGCDTYG